MGFLRIGTEVSQDEEHHEPEGFQPFSDESLEGRRQHASGSKR